MCCSHRQNEKPSRIEGVVSSQVSSQRNHVNKWCSRCEEQKMEPSPCRRKCLFIKLGSGKQSGDLLLVDGPNFRHRLKIFKTFRSSPSIK